MVIWMRRYVLTPLAAVMFLGGTVLADVSFPGVGRIEAVLDVDFGYRVDTLDWSIAGESPFGNNVNILSELIWKGLNIYQVGGILRVFDERGFVMKGYMDYGWVLDGDNQDSDYAGNDRRMEYSRSNNASDGGRVYDISLGWGYRLRPGGGPFTVIPLVGYSYHKQNLKMKDGFQTVSRQDIDPDVPSVGPFSGLQSVYEARWKGPWLGLEMAYTASGKVSIHGGVEYHWVDYRAEADWNLRTDLDHPKSFTHDADGTGIVWSAGLVYILTEGWSLNAAIDGKDWSTGTGKNTYYRSDGSTPTTTLNEVEWDSIAGTLGLTYTY